MKNIIQKSISVVLLSVCLIILFAPITRAAYGDYTLLEPLPCLNGTPGCTQATLNIQDYVSYVFNLFIAISAVAAVFMIVLGGFIYMTADAVSGKEDGLAKVSGAVKGLLMVLLSFLILRTINPNFVNIPANLVEPIGLNATVDITNSMAAYENQLWDQYKVNVTEKREEVVALTETQKTLEEKVASLEDELNTENPNDGLTEEEYDAKTQELAAAKVELASTTSTINYDKTTGVMQSVAMTCTATPTTSCADEQSTIAKKFISTIESITDPAQKAAAQQQAIYSYNEAAINKQIGLVTDATTPSFGTSVWDSLTNGGYGLVDQKTASISAINTIVTNYANSSNPDPSVLAQLKAKQREATIQISAAKYAK